MTSLVWAPIALEGQSWVPWCLPFTRLVFSGRPILICLVFLSEKTEKAFGPVILQLL